MDRAAGQNGTWPTRRRSPGWARTAPCPRRRFSGTDRTTRRRCRACVITRRQAIAFGLFVVTVVGFLYFVLPKLAGVGTTLHHIEHGDNWWIAIGVVLELLSFAGYVVLFRAVFVREREPRSAGRRATRSRWPAWPPRACSRRRAPVGSR